MTLSKKIPLSEISELEWCFNAKTVPEGLEADCFIYEYTREFIKTCLDAKKIVRGMKKFWWKDPESILKQTELERIIGLNKGYRLPPIDARFIKTPWLNNHHPRFSYNRGDAWALRDLARSRSEPESMAAFFPAISTATGNILYLSQQPLDQVELVAFAIDWRQTKANITRDFQKWITAQSFGKKAKYPRLTRKTVMPYLLNLGVYRLRATGATGPECDQYIRNHLDGDQSIYEDKSDLYRPSIVAEGMSLLFKTPWKSSA